MIIQKKTIKTLAKLIVLFFIQNSVVVAQNNLENAYSKVHQQTNSEQLAILKDKTILKEKKQREVAYQKAIKHNWPIRKEFRNGVATELIKLDFLQHPVYYSTFNDVAALSTGANLLHRNGGLSYDLNGNGMIIGEWDAGALVISHQEFDSSRVLQIDGSTRVHDHAQHVAGTLVAKGVKSYAKGMAPEATLWAHDWNSDESEMIQAAANGLLISQHSYGSITGWFYDGDHSEWYWYGNTNISTTEDYRFGFYTNGAADWDNIAYNAPYYLIVKSAGNDRGSYTGGFHKVRDNNGNWVTSNQARDKDGGALGYDCLPTKANAKNILTVGAVNDVYSYTDPSSVTMSSFSSWGPTDDGRIKPDLVGNGVGLTSPSITHDSSYSTKSGTSMSGPNVSGSLLLVQEHYANKYGSFMKAATLKALAIQTCKETGPDEGPDYMFGWGLLDVAKAVQVIDSSRASIQEQRLANQEMFRYTFYNDGSSSIRTSIAWTDIPGNVGSAALNDRTLKLIHDLDLRLVTPKGDTIFPYTLNPYLPQQAAQRGDNFRDNVEQVFLESAQSGYYTILISHKNNLNHAQDFALVVEGIDQAPELCIQLDSLSGSNSSLSKITHQTIDIQGNKYLAGSFQDSIELFDTTLYSLNRQSMFLAKLDANHQLSWSINIEGDSLSKITDIEVDSQANIYIAFSVANNINLQSQNFSNPNIGANSLVLQLSSNAQINWSRTLSSSQNQINQLLIHDNLLSLIGYFEGTLSNNQGSSLNNLGTGKDAFYAQLQLNGQYNFLQNYGGTNSEDFLSICSDDFGKLWIGGYFEGNTQWGINNFIAQQEDAVLLQINPSNATITQAKQLTSTHNSKVVQVVNNQGYIYPIIEFSNNLQLANQSISTNNSMDLVLAKYNYAGNAYEYQLLSSPKNIDFQAASALEDKIALAITFEDTLMIDTDSLYSSTRTNKIFVLEAHLKLNRELAIQSPVEISIEALSYQKQDFWIVGAYKQQLNLLQNQLNGGLEEQAFWIDLQTNSLPKVDLGADLITYCNENIQLQATLQGAQSYTWSPNQFLTNPTSLSPSLMSDSNRTYSLSVQNNCGQEAIDYVNVIVDADSNMQILLTKDTAIQCRDSVLVQPQVQGYGTLSYRWAPGLGVAKPFEANTLIAPPSQGLNYTFYLMNNCGGQITANINIQNIVPSLNITTNRDTSIMCDDSLQLNTIVTGDSLVQYNWIPSTGLNNSKIANPMVAIDQDQVYTVQVLGGCNSFNYKQISLTIKDISDSILLSNDTLFAYANKAPYQYQWYLDGQMIPQANSPYYIPSTNGSYYVEISSPNCNQQSNSLQVSLDAVEKITENNLQIYPNPTKGKLHILLPLQSGKTNALIYNSLGQEVRQFTLNSTKNALDISMLSKGCYYLKIIHSNTLWSKKIILE